MLGAVREDLDVLYSAGGEGALVPGFPGRDEAEQELLHGCGPAMPTLPEKPPPAPGAAGAGRSRQASLSLVQFLQAAAMRSAQSFLSLHQGGKKCN